MKTATEHTILVIEASANGEDALTRQLARETVSSLRASHPNTRVQKRDLAKGIDLLDQDWLDANLKPQDERSVQHKQALEKSEELINELRSADSIVISTPMYNFSIPAALKAWIDQVARAGVTFRYSSDGPEGLLEDRPVYLIMTSGGVPFGSSADFASGYLRHVLGFIGLHDVRFIGAEATNRDPESSKKEALEQLATALVKTASHAA